MPVLKALSQQLLIGGLCEGREVMFYEDLVIDDVVSLEGYIAD